MSYDPDTFRFYQENAEAYAAAGRGHDTRALDAFLDGLPSGARVLELGCGGGTDAARMLARGFDVIPTDGSPALAAVAAARLGRPVAVLRFDELDEEQVFEGVWAQACLLHAALAALPDILARVRRALRPGGVFQASYKAGDGEGRDRLGRFYNFPGPEVLQAAYVAAGPWAALETRTAEGGGFDGVVRTWLSVRAVR